mgnify:CR=1 FL=1
MTINYKHIPKPLSDNCTIVIDSITYNMCELQEFYNEFENEFTQFFEELIQFSGEKLTEIQNSLNN